MQDERGSTALIAASAEGHLETAKLLVHRGALVNFQNKVRVLHRIARNLVRNQIWRFGGLPYNSQILETFVCMATKIYEFKNSGNA